MITAAARVGVARHHSLPVAKRHFPRNTSDIRELYLRERLVRSAARPFSPIAHQRNKASFATINEPAASISVEDETVNYLRGLVNRFPKGPPQSFTDPKRRKESLAASGSLDTLGLPTQLPNAFIGAIRAMHQKDTRLLLIYLKNISRLPSYELQQAVTALPRSTFTEFIYCLDPFYISRDADPTDKTRISAGMYRCLNASALVNEYGVRKIYVRVAERLFVILQALEASGQGLHMGEYSCLLRCAGAACDINFAKYLWRQMDSKGIQAQRTIETYYEFIGARFLTEPLYTGFDKTQVMATPRTIHHNRKPLHPSAVRAVDRVNYVLRVRKRRFGLNQARPEEEIGRETHKSAPPKRVIDYIMSKKGVGITEEILYRMIIAYSRGGRLRSVAGILANYFGIAMTRVTYYEAETRKPYVTNRGKRILRRSRYLDSPIQVGSASGQIKPSPRLMEVIVEAYGSMGDIALAEKLVEYISNTYKIPIPLSVWSDLLEWTYIHGSGSVAELWRKGHYRWKIPGSRALEILWTKMTSAPHHIRPEFPQYAILIRKLVAQRDLGEALPFMREGLRFYDDQCREFEEAVFEYTQSMRDAVDVRASLHRYERARFNKEVMWYEIRSWVKKYLRNKRFNAIHDKQATQQLPRLFDEFGEFMGKTNNYRLATGYVTIKDPVRQGFYQPEPLRPGTKGPLLPVRWRNRKTNQWSTHMLGGGRHSQAANLTRQSQHALVGYKTNTRTKDILLGNRDRMRTT